VHFIAAKRAEMARKEKRRALRMKTGSGESNPTLRSVQN